MCILFDNLYKTDSMEHLMKKILLIELIFLLQIKYGNVFFRFINDSHMKLHVFAYLCKSYILKTFLMVNNSLSVRITFEIVDIEEYRISFIFFITSKLQQTCDP